MTPPFSTSWGSIGDNPLPPGRSGTITKSGGGGDHGTLASVTISSPEPPTPPPNPETHQNEQSPPESDQLKTYGSKNPFALDSFMSLTDVKKHLAEKNSNNGTSQSETLSKSNSNTRNIIEMVITQRSVTDFDDPLHEDPGSIVFVQATPIEQSFSFGEEIRQQRIQNSIEKEKRKEAQDVLRSMRNFASVSMMEFESMEHMPHLAESEYVELGDAGDGSGVK